MQLVKPLNHSMGSTIVHSAVQSVYQSVSQSVSQSRCMANALRGLPLPPRPKAMYKAQRARRGLYETPKKSALRVVKEGVSRGRLGRGSVYRGL